MMKHGSIAFNILNLLVICYVRKKFDRKSIRLLLILSRKLGGASLSTKSELSSIQSQALINKRTKPIRPSKLPKPSLRTYNDIVNSGAYNQPDYHPKPISMHTLDLLFSPLDLEFI